MLLLSCLLLHFQEEEDEEEEEATEGVLYKVSEHLKPLFLKTN